MNVPYLFLIGVVLIWGLLVTGCATRKVTRAMPKNFFGDPPDEIDNGKAWYIESAAKDGSKPFSCSFVEFDDRGDYLDFRQHRHAYMKIRDLAQKEKQRLMVLIYVHGWKNNAQSGDVVEFNNFLRTV